MLEKYRPFVKEDPRVCTACDGYGSVLESKTIFDMGSYYTMRRGLKCEGCRGYGTTLGPIERRR